MTPTTYNQVALDDFVRLFTATQPYRREVGEQIIYDPPEMATLVDRLYAHGVGVLPRAFGEGNRLYDQWYILGHDRSALDGFVNTIARFIVPSYASFKENAPFLYSFVPTNNVGLAASKVFVGYYCLHSPRNYRKTILAKLKLCYELLEQAQPPSVLQLSRQSYSQLYMAFQEALLHRRWAEADHLLETIDSANLTTATNLHYLRIEWLAQQEKWSEIWEHPYFRLLARGIVPRPVRSAMLTAFHAVNLIPHEQSEDFDKALSTLQQMRSTLGLLLHGRFGLKHPAILRVFAYLAVCDSDREMFARVVQDVTKEDFQTRVILTELERRLPSVAPIDKRSEAEKLRDSLMVSNYETAWELTKTLDDPLYRLSAEMQISVLSGEIALARETMTHWNHLLPELRRSLYEQYPDSRDWTAKLRQLLDEQTAAEIRTWAEWFESAQINPVNSALLTALDKLALEDDEQFWKLARVAALTEKLAELSNDEYQRHSVYRQAISLLIQTCLRDTEFPRSDEVFAELYEYLLEFLTLGPRNESASDLMLQLQKAVLKAQPERWREAYRRLSNWFAHPQPAFQVAALDAIELLVFYGAAPAFIHQWFRTWVEEIVDNPTTGVEELSVWRSLAEWMNIGDDLLSKLRDRLAQAAPNDLNPIAHLPADYQIAIFSLDQAASERARSILLEQNPGLDIRICTDTVNTRQVNTLARNADLVVMVTDKISHAVSYAVSPLAKGRIAFANRRGASTILRSINKFLQGVDQTP